MNTHIGFPNFLPCGKAIVELVRGFHRNDRKHFHKCSCDFFLMWNRVKYAINICMADKHATSNFPPKTPS